MSRFTFCATTHFRFKAIYFLCFICFRRILLPRAELSVFIIIFNSRFKIRILLSINTPFFYRFANFCHVLHSVLQHISGLKRYIFSVSSVFRRILLPRAELSVFIIIFIKTHRFLYDLICGIKKSKGRIHKFRRDVTASVWNIRQYTRRDYHGQTI